jgi:hypothetical protein
MVYGVGEENKCRKIHIREYEKSEHRYKMSAYGRTEMNRGDNPP